MKTVTDFLFLGSKITADGDCNHEIKIHLLLGRKAMTNLVKVKVKSLSCVRLFATPWTVAYQAPPSMGFSRQECWSGLPFPSPGDLPNPGIEPGSPALRADALPSEPPGKPRERLRHLSCSHWPSWVTRWVRPCGMKTVPCDLPTEYSYFMRPGKTRRKNSPLVHKIVRNGKMLF